MFDEVQCGLGRLGTPMGFRSIIDDADFQPDAVSWAKGLGGGIPIGAIWVSDHAVSAEHPEQKMCDVLGPGSHGSTFGGNPLVSATSLAVLEEIHQHRLWENAAERGKQLVDGIREFKSPLIKEVRGLGLMLGIVLDEAAYDSVPGFAESPAAASAFTVQKLMDAGLMTIPAKTNVVRLLPALDITAANVEEALHIMNETLQRLSGS